MRQFPIDEVITCATGRLVSKRHMDAVYDLLNYMTGDNLFTHQLPRAMDECKPYILDACPQIEQLNYHLLDHLLRCDKETGESAESACHMWVKQESARLGLPDMVTLSPIPRDDHDVIDPITELRMMSPAAQISIIDLDRL